MRCDVKNYFLTNRVPITGKDSEKKYTVQYIYNNRDVTLKPA